MDTEHWTDKEFRKLAQQGFKLGYLPHGGQPYEEDYHSPKRFKGYNDLNTLLKKNMMYDEDWIKTSCHVFYGISPNDSIGDNPPHHHLMAFVYPKEGNIKDKSTWMVLGYVVELWRYKNA